MMWIIAVISTLLMATSTAKPDCREFPNYETENYTYTVCMGALDVIDLDSTREYCQQNFNSDIIEFKSEVEYNFITSKLNNETDSEKFRYIPGFAQRKKEGDRFNPQTGEFYWVSDPDITVTSESETYWQPFKDLILNFQDQSFSSQQKANFVMDLGGAWYPGSAFSGTPPLETAYSGGTLICMRPGVPARDVPQDIDTSNTGHITTEEDPFQYWIVIAVAVGVVVIGLILGLVIFVVHKKSSKKQEQKFHKVPQAENPTPHPV